MSIAGETKLEAERAQWVHGAFIGWQTVSGFGGSKVGPFKKYLKAMGLELPGEKMTKEKVAQERQRAERNAERVRRAFDGG